MAGQLELVFEPRSGRFDPHDDRWQDQITALVTELRREASAVPVPGRPESGAKGAMAPIVLAFLSGGSLTAMVELVRAWLSRDKTRSLKVSWSAEGDVRSVELSGAGVGDTAFDELLRAVLDRVAGAE